jgi:hypothetical protein
MTRTVKEAMANKAQGFARHNSVFLPCHFELISIWIGKEMSLLSRPDHLVDFCKPGGAIGIREGSSYTNLVFRDHKELNKEFGHYKGHIVLHITEKGGDVFDLEQRHYLRLGFRDDSDGVFIELIDDPFKL